jgi:hypothetical protein
MKYPLALAAALLLVSCETPLRSAQAGSFPKEYLDSIPKQYRGEWCKRSYNRTNGANIYGRCLQGERTKNALTIEAKEITFHLSDASCASYVFVAISSRDHIVLSTCLFNKPRGEGNTGWELTEHWQLMDNGRLRIVTAAAPSFGD